tara:strand:+ start:623 stop:1105 length:483 start_codon:yes stop_codon:yes gene_type:complete
MALILNDRVKETSVTTGTSDFALDGAETGFQAFSAGVGANNTTYYAAADATDWEVGLGTLSSDGLTLARTTVYTSSNSDAKVSFSAGTKNVFVSYPASVAASALQPADNVSELTNDAGYLTGVFPFFDSAGVLDTISLITGSALPFFDSTGAAKNIALTP